MIFAEILTDLEKYGALSDTWFTAEQDQRAFNKSAAEYAVQFSETGIIAYIAVYAYIIQFKYAV